MGQHWKSNRREQLRLAATLIEPIAKEMIREGNPDATKTAERQEYLKWVQGCELMNAISLLRTVGR